MPHKSWKARQRRNQPAPGPVQEPSADELRVMFGRVAQAEIWAELKRKYRGNIPAPLHWAHLADRRELVTSSASRVRLARG